MLFTHPYLQAINEYLQAGQMFRYEELTRNFLGAAVPDRYQPVDGAAGYVCWQVGGEAYTK